MPLILIMLLAMFAGCAGAQETPPSASPEIPASRGELDDPFTFYCDDGRQIRMGASRAETAKVLQGDEGESFVADFEVDQVQRVEYWATAGVQIDYENPYASETEAKVIAMRFVTPEWKLSNGVTVGMTLKEISDKYEPGIVKTFPDHKDAWISLDEAGNPIPFSETSPYMLWFLVDDGPISMVLIEKN